jgi:hypothetical protein
MLRKESATVRLYLERASNASEKAAAAVDPATRRFYLAMESKWMDLAASTAVVERDAGPSSWCHAPGTSYFCCLSQ